MKTLIILDKSGSIGLRYALVQGDVSKFNGLVLNKETESEKECINFIVEAIKTDNIHFDDTLVNKTWDKVASIVYYEPIPLKNLI